MIWYPANYCARYAERCQAPYDGPPHYPKIPRIVVADFATRHLDLKRARYWRKARAYALAQWEQGGLEFVVREDMMRPYRSGRITIDVTPTHDGTAGQADFGALPEYPVTSAPEIPKAGVAWAHVNTAWFEQRYLSGFGLAQVSRVLCHEIGHTLGFGHGGTGVMTTSYQTGVNAEEIAALQAYWGLA